jgi:hypothetical protein
MDILELMILETSRYKLTKLVKFIHGPNIDVKFWQPSNTGDNNKTWHN